jgi:ribosomal protein S18 acetylase RimI-like enzyme
MPDNFRFRAATSDDLPALLDLMVLSSFGGITEAWQRVKKHGETWQQRGLAELGDANCEIGYSRFIVAEEANGSAGNGLAGMILLNVVGDTSQMNPALEPPEQVGVVALLKAAQHSVFIREFALFEWARGKGLAREFLDLTERLSVSNGARRVTLIVNDQNEPALALYRKAGFTPCDQQPSINHPHFSDSSLLVLMEKQLSVAKVG